MPQEGLNSNSGPSRREFLKIAAATATGYLTKGSIDKTFEKISSLKEDDLQSVGRDLGIEFTKVDFRKILRRLLNSRDINSRVEIIGKNGSSAIFYLEKILDHDDMVRIKVIIRKETALLPEGFSVEGLFLDPEAQPQKRPTYNPKTKTA